jgi:hypothetical protein
MYIYRVKNDGTTCEIRALRKRKPIPEGWKELPRRLWNKDVYIVNGKPTLKEAENET